jgi:hypothetical protein
MLTGNDVAVLLAFFGASVSLAGFSGIITAIDRGAAPASSEVIAFRLQTLVTNAIVLAVAALLPLVMEALELVSQTLWQFCAMCAAIILSISLGSAFQAFFKLVKGRSRGLSLPLGLSLIICGLLAMILDILAAGGLVPARGAYFLTLTQLLMITLTMFYRIILIAIDATNNSVPSPPKP